jgi:hypothetical protein
MLILIKLTFVTTHSNHYLFTSIKFLKLKTRNKNVLINQSKQKVTSSDKCNEKTQQKYS